MGACGQRPAGARGPNSMLERIVDILVIIAPIFCVAGVAAVITRFFEVDGKTLATFGLYIFGPCLIYSKLMVLDVPAAEIGRICLCFLLILGALWAVSFLFAMVSRKPAEERNTFYMSTMFFNAINYGFPVCWFAFGDQGLELAVVVAVLSNISSYSLAVYFAARRHHGTRDAVLHIFKLPAMYVVVLAVLCRVGGWMPPATAMRTVDMVGDGAVPLGLLILGIQLARARFHEPKPIILTVLLRLVISPLIAWAAVALLGIEGLPRNVIILQAAMPTAIMMSTFAARFGSDEEFISKSIAWTTLLSVVTVGVIIGLLTG